MKKQTLLLVAILLISSIFSVQNIYGQDKTQSDKEKEKDVKMQKSIEEQKKAMSDQKIQMDQKHQIELQYDQKELEDATNDEMENANRERTKIFMTMPRGNRSFNFNNEPFMVSDDMGGFYGPMGDNEERTTWDFSKSVKDNTFSRDYTFDVEKSTKSVVMAVMGDCKSGEIRIKILMPNGKSYSDILIDESGNLNWRKSFNITDTENQDKTGDWKFQISSSKATGFFKISLQAY